MNLLDVIAAALIPNAAIAAPHTAQRTPHTDDHINLVEPAPLRAGCARIGPEPTWIPTGRVCSGDVGCQVDHNDRFCETHMAYLDPPRARAVV